MNLSAELRKEVLLPVIAENNFRKKGNMFYKILDNGIVWIIHGGAESVVAKNDFLYYLNYGIYYKGIVELLYGFPFKPKGAVVDCVFKGGMLKSKIKEMWNTARYRRLT